MKIMLPLAIEMTDAQRAAYAAEHGIANTANAVRDHVIATVLTVVSEEIERTGSGQPPLGTVINRKARQ
jgi:hypothetical protein